MSLRQTTSSPFDRFLPLAAMAALWLTTAAAGAAGPASTGAAGPDSTDASKPAAAGAQLSANAIPRPSEFESATKADGRGPRTDDSALPNAPSAALSATAAQTSSSSEQSEALPEEGEQTKRILGIIPNFRSVSADSHPAPMDSHDKFVAFAKDSFDYSSFIFAGGVAGLNFLLQSTPEFHQGAKGYARYYWHGFVDRTDENLWVEYLLPATFHQDPRYYTKGHGSIGKRALYSVSRVFITRTDSGGEAFNVSIVAGTGIAAGISSLYYPSKERTAGNAVRQWGTSIGLDAATSIAKEFWPDVNRAVFHQK